MAVELRPVIEDYELVDKARIAASIYPDLRTALSLQEGQELQPLQLDKAKLQELPIAAVAFEQQKEKGMLSAPITRAKAWLDVVGTVLKKETTQAAYADYFLTKIPDAELFDLGSNKVLAKQTNGLGVSIYWLLDKKSFELKPYEHDPLKINFKDYNPYFDVDTIFLEDRNGQVTDLCKGVFGEERPNIRLNPVGYTNNTDIKTGTIDLFPLLKGKDARYGYERENFPWQIEVILHEFGHALYESSMTDEVKRKLKWALPALDGLTFSSKKQVLGKHVIALREIIPNVLALQLHTAYAENNFQITPEHTYTQLLELYNTIILKGYDSRYKKIPTSLGFQVADKPTLEELWEKLRPKE